MFGWRLVEEIDSKSNRQQWGATLFRRGCRNVHSSGTRRDLQAIVAALKSIIVP